MVPEVTVVVTTPLEEEEIAVLRAVDPRLDVVYPEHLISPARYPGQHPAPTLDAPGAREEWEVLLGRADVLLDFGPAELASSLAGRPRLRWIQSSSAGIGPYAAETGVLGSHVTVTNTSGVHARALAEFALMAMLMFTKGALGDLEAQRAHRWQKHAGEQFGGKTVCVVGLGEIGREVAALAKALDAHVVGVSRTPPAGTAAGVDEWGTDSALDDFLGRADFVVLSVPLTPETDGMLDRGRIEHLNPAAVIVNVARGAVVDEDALVDALRDGRIRGAALDVFRTEPLPPESPLWSLPNVLVSPHSAATVTGENARILEIFVANLRRYLAGDALHNVVDPDLLY